MVYAVYLGTKVLRIASFSTCIISCTNRTHQSPHPRSLWWGECWLAAGLWVVFGILSWADRFFFWVLLSTTVLWLWPNQQGWMWTNTSVRNQKTRKREQELQLLPGMAAGFRKTLIVSWLWNTKMFSQNCRGHVGVQATQRQEDAMKEARNRFGRSLHVNQNFGCTEFVRTVGFIGFPQTARHWVTFK